jgi:DNA/RNA endonuclease YhcR with UshA esterase domain
MSKYHYSQVRRVFAVMLVFLLIFTNLGSLLSVSKVVAVESAFTLKNGEIKKYSTVNISPGVQQTKLDVSTAKGPLKIYNMNIDPKNPYVAFEAGLSYGKLAGMQTVVKQAGLISKPGYEVVGGINGDFYNTSNGVPLEAVVHNGEVFRSGGSRNVVGILKNGEVKIGMPRISIEMEVTPKTESPVELAPQEPSALELPVQPEEAAQPEETTQPEEAAQPEETTQPEEAAQPEETTQPEEAPQPEEALQPEAQPKTETANLSVKMQQQETAAFKQKMPVSAINKERGASGIFLYTSKYDHSTYTNDNGTEVILENPSDILKPEGEVTATVKDVLKDTGNTKLEEGQMVLSGAGSDKEALEQLEPGDTITIRTTAPAPWNEVDEAIGGYHLLVKNGDAVESSDPYIHPRTAVGIKADGSVFFTVVDGRQPGISEGVTLTELGQMMKDMGAVEAINLDGGGSSTYVVRQPGDSSLTVVNTPSDGGERNVANSLLVVSTAPEGSLSHLSVFPQETMIFKGSSTSFTVKGQDEYFNPVALTDKVSWKADSMIGQFDESGVFTAGNSAAEGKVTAEVNNITNTASVKVVDKLDRITVVPSQLSLGEGESAKLKVTGYVNDLPVLVDANAFSYQVQGNVGTIDEFGHFTASSTAANGTIVVSIGDVVQEVNVDIGKPPIILEDFEDGIAGWTKSGARFKSIDIFAASEPEPVRFGTTSLRLDYDFTGQRGTSGAYAQPVDDISIEGYPEKIGMWLYGANDGHWVRAQLRDGNNSAFPVDFTAEKPGIDWNGWKYVEASVPKGRPTPLKLDLAVRVMETSDNNKNAASIYIDNIRAVYGSTNDDLKNPELTNAFPADNAITPAVQPVISVTAKDNDGGTGIDPSKIKMMVDGEVVQHIYNETTGKISYTPETFMTGGYHNVSVLVKDGFENPAQLSWNFFISAGSQYEMTGPEQVYAGDEFTLKLNAKALQELSKTKAILAFDPQKLQVIDQNEEADGIQLLPGSKLKPENIEMLAVDNIKGEIIFNTNKLESNADLPAADTLLHIPFKVSKTAKDNVSIELVNGEFTYVRGDVKKAFHKPFDISIAYKYLLDAAGISVLSTSKISVKDEKGSPVNGASINILAPQSLSKYAMVTADAAAVYKTADYNSEIAAQLSKGQKAFIAAEMEAFTEIYLTNGQKGFVANDQIAVSNLPNPLGTTDETGVLTTDLLALSQLSWKLQAEKDGSVSAVKDINIVPQIGGNKPQHVKLSWKKSPKTTQSIAWRTSPSVTATFVQFVQTSEFTDFTADHVNQLEGTNQLVADKAGEFKSHDVTLEELKPGTSYTYRVGDGSEQGWSEPYTFMTEPGGEEPFTFLFTTDSQAYDAAGNEFYGRLVKQAREAYPEARFMLHGGDIVDDAAKMEQWEHFFNSVEGQFSNMPIHAVLGNHDVYGDGEYLFQSFFENPENGPNGEQEWVYSFDYGDVHFAMLNSEFGSDSMKAQVEWLRKDMKASKKTWKIVMFHRAPYESNPTRGTDATRAIFAPVIEELEIDLALVGHDHSYARTHSMKNGSPSEAGSGTVYLIGGSSGPKFYSEQNFDYFTFLYGENKQVFTAVTVEEDKLLLEAVNIDGVKIDSFELLKKERASAPSTIQEARSQTSGTTVTIEGTASTASGSFGDRGFYLQDETSGAYIAHHEADVLPGDKVRVTGETAFVQGEFQIIDVTKLEVLDKSAVPVPKEVEPDQINADHESRLILLTEMKVVEVKQPEADGSFEFTAEKDGKQVTVRVDSRTGMEYSKVAIKEGDTVNLTGIPSQKDGTLFVKPRSQEDIVKSGAAPIDECFIATAAYGTKYTPAVTLLRSFRDQFLLTNDPGTKFVEFYYEMSPPIAQIIADNSLLKATVRGVLTPFVGLVYMLYHPWAAGAALLLLAGGIYLYKRNNRKLRL